MLEFVQNDDPARFAQDASTLRQLLEEAQARPTAVT
jgi:hypothetical protein